MRSDREILYDYTKLYIFQFYFKVRETKSRFHTFAIRMVWFAIMPKVLNCG